MVLHALTFTKDDSLKLYALYNTLTSHLEKGRELKPEYFIDLKLTMQGLLYNQNGLQDFWKEVQKEPHSSHHLHITHHDKELLNLPWQLAIDNLYISKGLPGIHSFDGYNPQPGPLRILVMIASPEDLDYDKRLSYEEEEQTILKVLAPLWETGQVQVDFTEDGSLESLQQHLQLQHYHILYFSGHGTYKENTGYLVLENAETLNSEYVTAQQFGQAIKEHSPPLVILSSCETAQGHVKDGFRGIADELIYMDVPAVIAMAFNITDQYAILFTAHLYEQLAKRKPLMEAYAEALSGMKEEEQRAGYYPSQWLIPQFYCSQKVTHIVDWEAPGQVLKVAAANFIKGEETLLLSPEKEKTYFFIGRRRENAFLFSKLTQDIPVLLRGQGGVGKTAMAEHLAKRLISQDPTRYCFAFNETNIGIIGIVERLKLYLENEGHLASIEFELNKKNDITNQLDLLLQQVALYCKPCWIFDNMESCQEEIGGPLIDEYTGWLDFVEHRLLHKFPVIFTGRYPIQELKNIAEVSLNQVSFVDFYRKCLQLNMRTFQQDLFKTASLLYTTLGGSYRVLEFFDEIYKNDPLHIQELLNQMTQLKKQVLMEKVQRKLENDGKRIVFSALLNVLSEQERSTLHLMLHFNGPIMPMALNMQLPEKNFDAGLQKLKALTLIEEYANGSYYITPLVRDWVEGVKLPVVEFYPEFAGDYYIHSFNKITRNYGDMERAFKCYTLTRNIDKINDTGAWIVSEYYRMGLYDRIIQIGKKVESIAGVDTDEEVLNNLGITYLKFGKFDLALSYLTKFLITVRRKGNKNKEAVALNSISQVFYAQNNLETTLVWLEKSRQLSKENGFLENEAVALTNIGNIYVDRKQFDNGLETFKRSLQIRRLTKNQEGEIRVMIQMSLVYSLQEEHHKAIKTLLKSISIAREANAGQLEGTALNLIGLEYERLEEYETALEYLREGLAISEEVGDQEGIGRALSGLGMVHKMLGNYDEAVEYVAKGAMILQKFGYGDMDATASWHLGNICIARGDYAEALPLLMDCLPLFKAIGDQEGVGHALNNIAEAYIQLGEFDQAIPYLEENIPLKQLLGDTAGEIVTLNRLSAAYVAKDDIAKALKYEKKIVALQRSLGDNIGLAKTYFNLSFLYAAKGKDDLFYKNALQAYSLNAEANNLEGLYLTGAQLGFYFCTSEDGIEPDPEVLQMGLWFLEQSYEIGLQSDYPDVEELGDKIKEFTQTKAIP